MRRGLWGCLLAVLLAGTACAQPGSGGSSGATPASGSTAGAAATATPTPLFGFPVLAGVTCPDLASLAIDRMLLRSSDPNRRDVALCDARDLAHPRTLTALEGSSNDVFLTRSLIGYVALTGGGPTATPDQVSSHLRTLDLASGQVTELSSFPGIALAAGWSADRSMVADFHDTGDSHHFALKRGEAPAVALGPAIPLFGRGGSLDDQLLVSFSPDGQYVLFVDTYVNRLQVFRTVDGVAVYTAPSGGAGGFRTMATWAHQGDTFYFRNNTGVYRWDPQGGINTYAAGLRWFHPGFSADDQSLAYAVMSSDGVPHVEIRAMSGGTTVSSAPWRSAPVFLSSSAVLLEEDQACPADGMCLGYVRADKSAVLHLDTRTETDLGISGWTVGALWPHA